MNYFKDHAFKIFALSIVAIIGIAVTFISPVSMLLAVPPGDPPTADVSATFYDNTITNNLDVSGTTTLGATTLSGDTVVGVKGVSTPDLTVYGDTFTKGHVYLGNGAADNIDVRGTLKNQASSGKVIVDDDFQINGNMTFGSNSSDWVNVKGKMRNDDLNATLLLDDTVATTGALGVGTYLGVGNDLTMGGNINIGGAVTTPSEPLEMNTDVTIAGNLFADSFGQFYSKNCPTDPDCWHQPVSDWKPGVSTGIVPASSWGHLEAYCDSDDMLLSCFGGFHDIGDSNLQWITSIQYATWNGHGCIMNLQNNTASGREARLYVTCLDTNEYSI